jgi:hypothetical protein
VIKTSDFLNGWAILSAVVEGRVPFLFGGIAKNGYTTCNTYTTIGLASVSGNP